MLNLTVNLKNLDKNENEEKNERLSYRDIFFCHHNLEGQKKKGVR